jgi:hypothetical protein
MITTDWSLRIAENIISGLTSLSTPSIFLEAGN